MAFGGQGQSQGQGQDITPGGLPPGPAGQGQGWGVLEPGAEPGQGQRQGGDGFVTPGTQILTSTTNVLGNFIVFIGLEGNAYPMYSSGYVFATQAEAKTDVDMRLLGQYQAANQPGWQLWWEIWQQGSMNDVKVASGTQDNTVKYKYLIQKVVTGVGYATENDSGFIYDTVNAAKSAADAKLAGERRFRHVVIEGSDGRFYLEYDQQAATDKLPPGPDGTTDGAAGGVTPLGGIILIIFVVIVGVLIIRYIGKQPAVKDAIADIKGV